MGIIARTWGTVVEDRNGMIHTRSYDRHCERGKGVQFCISTYAREVAWTRLDGYRGQNGEGVRFRGTAGQGRSTRKHQLPSAHPAGSSAPSYQSDCAASVPTPASRRGYSSRHSRNNITTLPSSDCPGSLLSNVTVVFENLVPSLFFLSNDQSVQTQPTFAKSSEKLKLRVETGYPTPSS